MKRRDLLLGGLAAALLGTKPGKAFAQSACANGAFFDESGQLCPIMPGQGLGAEPYNKVSDAGIAEQRALLVRPQGVAAPTDVRFSGPQGAGSLVLDQRNQYLYFVRGNGIARRYVVCVGRAGRAMSTDQREVYHMTPYPHFRSADGNVMAPGPTNPLGVRGMYLRPIGGQYEGYMVHGTASPERFTQADGQRTVSNGCVRMLNPDVIELYSLVQPGARFQAVNDASLMSRYLASVETAATIRPA